MIKRFILKTDREFKIGFLTTSSTAELPLGPASPLPNRAVSLFSSPFTLLGFMEHIAFSFLSCEYALSKTNEPAFWSLLLPWHRTGAFFLQRLPPVLRPRTFSLPASCQPCAILVLCQFFLSPTQTLLVQPVCSRLHPKTGQEFETAWQELLTA